MFGSLIFDAGKQILEVYGNNLITLHKQTNVRYNVDILDEGSAKK